MNAIAQAVSIEQVWQSLVGILSRIGFDLVNYGYASDVSRFRRGNIGGGFYLSTWPRPLTRSYFEGGLYARTPMFRWATLNQGVCSWGWSYEERRAGRLSDDECRALDEISRLGLRAGITISFVPTSSRGKAAMGLGAPRYMDHEDVDSLWACVGDKVMALCNMAHLRLIQMPLPSGAEPLTGRQREILEWVADGKTMQDISLLTRLSQSAVEKHLRNIRERLQVETTAQAVARASFLNQLFVPDGAESPALARPAGATKSD